MNIQLGVVCGFCGRSGAEVGQMVRGEKNVICKICSETLLQQFDARETPPPKKPSILELRMAALRETLRVASGAVGQFRRCFLCNDLFRLSPQHFSHVLEIGNQIFIRLIAVSHQTRSSKGRREIQPLILRGIDCLINQVHLAVLHPPCINCRGKVLPITKNLQR